MTDLSRTPRLVSALSPRNLFCAATLSTLALVACDDSDGPHVQIDAGADVRDANDAAGGDTADADAADAAGDAGAGPVAIAPDEVGVWNVGVAHVEITAGERALPVVAWYPTTAESQRLPLSASVAEGRRDTLDALVDAAPEGCPTAGLELAPDGTPAAGTRPLVVYSHCHECIGASGASVAHRLASWGFVVLAPDHVDNTLWDGLDDAGVEISGEFLEVRGADVIAVLDAALTPDGAFSAIAPSIDPGAVAVVGHSFGAVTAGYVAERDARVAAAVAIAAPVQNPLIPGVTAANIDVPMLFVVAVEDNSISEFGNIMLRDNYAAVSGPATKVEVADAGHWSVSDICGVIEGFLPGCGDGERQTNGQPFTYLDADLGREITATWVTGFLGATLLGDDGATAWLADPGFAEHVSVESRE